MNIKKESFKKFLSSDHNGFNLAVSRVCFVIGHEDVICCEYMPLNFTQSWDYMAQSKCLDSKNNNHYHGTSGFLTPDLTLVKINVLS